MEEKIEIVESPEELLQNVVSRIQREEPPGLWADTEGAPLRFVYQYQGGAGTVILDLYPEDKLIAWALTQSREIIKKTTLAYFLQLEKEGKLKRTGEPIRECNDEITEAEACLAEMLAWWFLRAMQGKISMALGELSQEAVFVMEKTCQDMLVRSAALGGVDDKSALLSGVKDELNKFARDLIAERKAFLKGSISTFASRPRMENLAEEYSRLHPIWQDAKSVYEQNSHRTHWRKMVKDAISDEQLPDDLIGRLSGKLNDIPEEMQAKLSEKGGAPKPSDIALEHSARLCGTAPYSLTIRRLYQLLEKRNIGGEMGADEVFH